MTILSKQWILGGMIFSLLGTLPMEDATAKSASKSLLKASFRGDFKGKIQQDAVIKYIPAEVTSIGVLRPHYKMTTGLGAEQIRITLIFPVSAKLGEHAFSSSDHPLNVGRYFDIIVTHTEGQTTTIYQKQTHGTLKLQSFPESPDKLKGSKIKGAFHLNTTSADGKKTIKVKGRFQLVGQ